MPPARAAVLCREFDNCRKLVIRFEQVQLNSPRPMTKPEEPASGLFLGCRRTRRCAAIRNSCVARESRMAMLSILAIDSTNNNRGVIR